MNYFTIWVSNCWLLILDKVPPRGPREARAPVRDAWLRQVPARSAVRGQCMSAGSAGGVSTRKPPDEVRSGLKPGPGRQT